MGNNKANFIKTKDADTAKILEQEGFKLVDNSNGTWTFMNDTERLFTFEKGKAVYSNKLCF